MKQCTLKNSFKVQGKGLHTGLIIEAEFCPAEDNYGYKIQRIDLPGEPIIDAVAENVVATTRGTVLSRGDESPGDTYTGRKRKSILRENP